MKTLSRMWIPVLLQAALALTACDDDDPDPVVDSGRPDSGMDAGTDAGTDAAASDAGTYMCGTTVCPALMTNPLSTIRATPCCAPTDGGTSPCSGSVTTDAGTICFAPAVADTRCPSFSIQGTNLQGCCAPLTQTCGINSNTYGLGCQDNATVRMNIPALQAVITEAAVRPCDPDAGTALTIRR